MWQSSCYSVEIFPQTFGIITEDQTILSESWEILELFGHLVLLIIYIEHSVFVKFICLDSESENSHFPGSELVLDNASLVLFLSETIYVYLKMGYFDGLITKGWI